MADQNVRGQVARGGGPMGGAMATARAKDARGAARRLVAYLKPYRGKLVLVTVLLVVGAGLSLAGPLLIGQAIDTIIKTHSAQGLLRIAGLMTAAGVGTWLAGSLQAWIMAGVSQYAVRDMRRGLFEHLQTLSMSYFDHHSQGDLMSRLTNDMDAISQTLSQDLTSLVSNVFSVAAIIGIMLALNRWLALTAFAMMPFMFLLTGGIMSRTRALFLEQQRTVGTLNGVMDETVSGQRVVQAFGQEATALSVFDKSNQATLAAGRKAQFVALLAMPLLMVLDHMDIAVVAGVGGTLAIKGIVTVGVVSAFITYTQRLSQPLLQVANLLSTIQAALAGAERVFEVIDHQPELRDKPDAPQLGEIQGDVAFDHVDFGYLKGVPVLRDVNLHALPGQMVALVGPTGAGKTTMVSILSRFYDIQGGRVTIDGTDIRDVQVDSLRRQLGIVLQDGFLFSASVKENLRYGRLDATDEDVVAAATLANADRFIRRLPQGYDTVLAERGSDLSQGQRQLLTIARAILADPRILVLDEATSSVDTRTEIHIQRALLNLMKGRTSFVIAHRLSTIRTADQVLVIDGGHIIEQGTHTSLLAQHWFYYNLYMSQFKGTAAPAPVS
ncbi:MAG: ABC transporter ATP-binding protein [Caldiserica bacterium]|nr:ABC transporter ATP-binding protein [Caldisericota bacterium]